MFGLCDMGRQNATSLSSDADKTTNLDSLRIREEKREIETGKWRRGSERMRDDQQGSEDNANF